MTLKKLKRFQHIVFYCTLTHPCHATKTHTQRFVNKQTENCTKSTLTRTHKKQWEHANTQNLVTVFQRHCREYMRARTQTNNICSTHTKYRICLHRLYRPPLGTSGPAHRLRNRSSHEHGGTTPPGDSVVSFMVDTDKHYADGLASRVIEWSREPQSPVWERVT